MVVLKSSDSRRILALRRGSSGMSGEPFCATKSQMSVRLYYCLIDVIKKEIPTCANASATYSAQTLDSISLSSPTSRIGTCIGQSCCK